MMHDKIAVPGMKAPRVKGRMAIELYNAETGELTHREERDNYVAEQWFEQAALGQQLWFGNFQSSGGDYSTYDEAWGADNSWGNPSRAPFAGLLLTDYAGAVNTEEMAPRGSACGTAAKGITTSGGFSGSFNSLESEFRNDYVRFVYDFATTQGNGVVQSIYTGPFNARTDDTVAGWVGTPVSSMRGSRFAPFRYVSDSGTQSMLGFGPTRCLYVRDFLQDFPTTDFENSGSSDYVDLPGGTYRGAESMGGDLYLLEQILNDTSSSRTMTIYSVSWADLAASFDAVGDFSEATLTPVHTFTDADLTAWGFTSRDSSHDSVFMSLAWNPHRNSWFLGQSKSVAGTPDWDYVELNPADWSVVGTYTYDSSYSNDYTYGLDFLPGTADAGMALIGGRLVEFDFSAGTVAAVFRVIGRYGNQAGSAYASRVGSNLLMLNTPLTSDRKVIGLATMQMFFSRVRLDAPVVKDNTNTMKVVYEFTINRADLFS